MNDSSPSDARGEPLLRERDWLTRLLRARPLLTAALLFLAGCILQFALALPALAMWVALGALALSALALRGRRRYALALAALMLIPAGMLRFDIAWTAVEPLPEQEDARISGRVCEMPEYREESPRVTCTLEDCSVNGEPIDGRLLLYLRGNAATLRSIELGQELRVAAHLRPWDVATNPGQFDLSNYYRARGVRSYATADVADADFTGISRQPGDYPKRLRAWLGERVDRLFPRNAPLARALVLGDRSALADEERERFARSGAAHLLAISGMHLSVLALLLSALLRFFMRRDAAFWLTFALLTAYGALVGFVPSLTRALVMYAILGFAHIPGRASDGPTRLGAALLIHLLIQPVAILDAGFVLSYAATAGILLLSAPLSRLPLLSSVLDARIDFHSPGQRILRWAASIVTMTLSAQLAILPASVQFFGVQPVWSLLTNLVAAPLTMLAYGVALVGTLANLAPVAAVADALFSFLEWLVTRIAALPLAQVRVARFPLWLVGLCVLICLAASELSRLPKRLRTWLPFAALLAIPLSNLLSWCGAQGVSVVFLDAEQADCAVIRAEGRVCVIDAGDPYSPIADYLSATNYTPDALFLTHPHLDHAGGLSEMLTICAPRRIYIGANWEQYESEGDIAESLERARAMGSEVVHVSAGDAIALSPHTILRVLSPKAGIPADAANEDSLILRLEYGEARALFLADAPSEVTEGLGGDIDLLKVAHHGAKDGTSANLLTETSPSAAVISVGRGNRYGHPVPRVLELLDAVDAQIWRTDRSGAITCRLYEDGSLRLRGYLSGEVENGLE